MINDKAELDVQGPKTPAAEESLLDIKARIYQSSGSIEITLKELGRIDAKARQYANQPMMGTARPDPGETVRCFTVDSFIVIYEPADDGITILLAIYGAQDVPRAFQKRFLQENHFAFVEPTVLTFGVCGTSRQKASCSEVVGHRPGRVEPRVNKRRPKVMALMTKPRLKYHTELRAAS